MEKTRTNIENIVEEIHTSLPENNKRFTYPWKDCAAETKATRAYLFEEKEKGKLNFWQKTYKHFFPRSFHEDYDKKLVKLAEEAGKRQYLKIIDKEDPELEKVCKNIADKYSLCITDNF